ncbi:MAG: leucine-rich repeat protein [Lachnospiraceae bacterium]|nr:leucine-rich repeat protein [Lachnospiraceae bacterium]
MQCEGNLLTAISFNDCIALEKVECYYNDLQILECTRCEKLVSLDCGGNAIETLDLASCMALMELTCSNNQLKALDLTNQTCLSELFCDGNKISELILPEMNSITRMNCEYNYLQDLSELEALSQKEGTWILYTDQNIPEDAIFAASDLENLKNFASTDKNLEKLDWNLEMPNTWSGVSWKYVNGVYYVQSIELCSMELTGNIIFSDMEQLYSVVLAENLLDSLEINNCAELKIINCADNRLEQLSLVNCNKISEIYAYYNCLSNRVIEEIIKTYGNSDSCIIELNSQYVKGEKQEFASKEMEALLSFAEQNYNAGRLMYDDNKPDRWDYVTWEKQQDGYYHIIAIDYSDMMIEGTLDLSEFLYLQDIDCSNTSLEEVILPNNLEKITLKAFYQCKLLKKVCIPASVKTIEDFAFAKCSNLTEVVFYSKNASLDSYSFYGSDAINKIVCYYNTTEANYSYEGKPTFQYWDKKDMSSDEKGENSNASGTNTTGDSTTNNATTSKASKLLKKGDVIKKRSGKYRVTKIGKSYGTVSYIKCTNKKIKSVTIPSTITVNKQKFKVTVIGEKAFYGCKKLKKVTIGKNVIKIKKYAFAKCSKLKTIKIQSISLKSVGKRAFKGISKKATISVPSSKKKKYTKLLRKKTVGLSSSVKIKGYKKK